MCYGGSSKIFSFEPNLLRTLDEVLISCEQMDRDFWKRNYWLLGSSCANPSIR